MKIMDAATAQSTILRRAAWDEIDVPDRLLDGIEAMFGERFTPDEAVRRILADVRQRNHGPVTVAPEHIFVMGDNRGASNDSRYFGPVPVGRVLGRAWLSYWPLNELHVIQ